MNGQYPHQFDQPWSMHPDADTPINDLDEPVVRDNPERPF